MKIISKSRLKAQMLQVFREVEADGKPVLKIEPITVRRSIFEVFAGFQHSVDIPEEALGPEWEEWGDFV